MSEDILRHKLDAQIRNRALTHATTLKALCERAGFSFGLATWKPGETGCRFLHIAPGPATARTPI